MPRLVSLALAAALAAGPVLACDDEVAPGGQTSYLERGAFTYDVFEASVAHTDLSECPQEFDPDVVFCRFATTETSGSIFIFSYEDDMPLLAIKHVPLDEVEAILQASAY
ncbi:hypothetical protein [Rhodovulum marinum]|uniref:Uncharacterized protein n=1 Tax=Rhodovulum marinum TaxID=320662 RepID=A0A4V2SR07_9RHOB|nr:hypothetical protein [Rhodovulum marinum]TCP41006.1 hypothetical protein EV662_106223 [Rhodovulum marinum]